MKYPDMKVVVVDELPKTANYGDVVIISGSYDMYAYMGEWTMLDACEHTSTDTGGDIVETNCPNCSAPIDRSLNKCPYCGTPYIRRGGEQG